MMPSRKISPYQGMALSGLLILFVILLANRYTYQLQSRGKALSDSNQRALLLPGMETISGKTFLTPFPIYQAYTTQLNKVNQKFRDKKEWDKVIYNEESLALIGDAVQPMAGSYSGWVGALGFLLLLGGIIGAGIKKYRPKDPSQKFQGVYHRPVSSRKWTAWILTIGLISFYVLLYWYPFVLTAWIRLLNPVSNLLNGRAASQWFMYGFLYTSAVLAFGIVMFSKYRHNTYQLYRTGSVMFFQLSFAFLIPEILVALNKPWYDLKNIWPLKYDFFFPYHINNLTGSGTLGWYMLVWGIILLLVVLPLLTYFYGKRWYCSWVCGCGGLAETAGDDFRHLSNKSLISWKIERYMVHGILVFITLITILTLANFFTGGKVLGTQTQWLQSVYGFAIASIFSGVIGTGLYPVMGNRVWCRFGCPLAAILGLIQRFQSRFRVTVNGGQCISCGNCSTHCEMGIDVKWYAQRGQDVVRSSCVGCGICAEVCPRGVLTLENAPSETRQMNGPIQISERGIEVIH